jgi:predicted dehydrogenase
MRIAFVGCGFVADHYARTLPLHPELEVAGVFDRDTTRASRFAAHHALPVYGTLDEVIRDESVAIVLNLTSPAAHFDVSRVP